MRFMMIVKATKDSEAGNLPSDKLLSAMGKYNEELQKAGVLLDLTGLHPSSRGARVRFEGKQRTVVDGPFAEAKELIAGYWLIQAKSLAEAIEWAKRAPFGTDMSQQPVAEVEIRQLFDPDDFVPGEGSDRAKALGAKLGKT